MSDRTLIASPHFKTLQDIVGLTVSEVTCTITMTPASFVQCMDAASRCEVPGNEPPARFLDSIVAPQINAAADKLESAGKQMDMECIAGEVGCKLLNKLFPSIMHRSLSGMNKSIVMEVLQILQPYLRYPARE